MVRWIACIWLLLLIGSCIPLSSPAPDKTAGRARSTLPATPHAGAQTVTLALAGDVMLARVVN